MSHMEMYNDLRYYAMYMGEEWNPIAGLAKHVFIKKLIQLFITTYSLCSGSMDPHGEEYINTRTHTPADICLV